MNAETWPKEAQRMCKGASGQVPISGVDRTADDDEYTNFNDSPIPGVNIEADFLWLESIARKHVGYGSSSRWSEIDRAAVFHSLVLMDCARTNAKAIRYAANSIVAAIREVAPEVAGAISEAGTDIGAGIALALEQALKTFPDDNTHNG